MSIFKKRHNPLQYIFNGKYKFLPGEKARPAGMGHYDFLMGQKHFKSRGLGFNERAYFNEDPQTRIKERYEHLKALTNLDNSYTPFSLESYEHIYNEAIYAIKKYDEYDKVW